MGILSKLFGHPSRDDFPERVIEALRADGIEDTIDLDAATYSLRLSGDTGEHVLHLGNFYAEYAKVPRQDRDDFLSGVVRRFRATTVPLPKNFDAEARQRLLPNLRSRCYFAFTNLAGMTNGLTPNLRPFRLLTNEMAIGLVLDYRETMRAIDHEQLEKWGVGEDEAMHVAVTNLRARTEPQFEQHAPGVWVSAWQDSYDATRLLLPEVIASLPVRGRHVAMVPHRNLLVVTGDMDAAGLKAMAGIAPTAFEEPQAISVTPLVRNGESWEELTLPDSHPAAPAFAIVRLQMRASEYDEQKDLLTAVAEKNDDTRFIASFMGTRNKETGVLSSYCTWSEGIDQNIPVADRVGFVSDRGGSMQSLGFARWEDVVRVMGPSMRETGDYPPRYIVDGFPTEEQLREMGVE